MSWITALYVAEKQKIGPTLVWDVLHFPLSKTPSGRGGNLKNATLKAMTSEASALECI